MPVFSSIGRWSRVVRQSQPGDEVCYELARPMEAGTTGRARSLEIGHVAWPTAV